MNNSGISDENGNLDYRGSAILSNENNNSLLVATSAKQGIPEILKANTFKYYLIFSTYTFTFSTYFFIFLAYSFLF